MLSLPPMEYGSVADWLSGVGTLLAVIVALWVAGAQQREDRRARRRRELEVKAESQAIIDQAIKLAELIDKNCQSILESLDEEAAGARPELTTEEAAHQYIMLNARAVACLHDMNGLRQQIIAIQSAAAVNVRAFIEISRMAYEADIGYVRNIDHRKVPKYELMRVQHDMGKRIEELQRIRAAL